jgi:hypothetical protein
MTQMMNRIRPKGVTALAVLQILLGLGALLMGAGSVMLMGMAGAYAPTAPLEASGMLGALSGVMGIIFLLVAVISFVVAWGYLAGKPWARIVGIVFAALDGLYGLTSMPGGLLTVVIAALMIYYLTRPTIIEWFSPGKATSSPVTVV